MRPTLTKLHPENYNPNARVTPDSKHSHPHTPVCCHHHDKQATHTLPHPQHQQQLYYCEKCAIMLASKGHNVAKVGRGNSSVKVGRKSPIRSQRQRQIQQFIGQLSYSIQQIGKRYEQAESILLSSQEHFNALLNEITNYFKQIEDVLEIQKYMAYNAVLNHRTTLQSQLRTLRQGMQEENEELINIGNDIQNNMQAVQLVEMPIYESIMDNYRQKLALAYQFNSIELSSLPRPTLLFPETPKMLYSLADKIKLIAQSIQAPNPIETIFIPHAFAKTSITNRSNPSRHQSCENSRGKINNEQFKQQRQKKSLSNLYNNKHTESTEKQLVFSFDSNQQPQIHKALFGIRSRQTFHPHQMMLRESLSLTEIRQNEEECEFNANRRYGGLLEETMPIPEEVVTSQESIAGYFANTLNYSIKDVNERAQETETLLIC